MVVPFVGDQFFWAQACVTKGVGPSSIRFRQLIGTCVQAHVLLVIIVLQEQKIQHRVLLEPLPIRKVLLRVKIVLKVGQLKI